MTYEQLKAWEEVVISSDDKEELTRQSRYRVLLDLVLQRQVGRIRPGILNGFLILGY